MSFYRFFQREEEGVWHPIADSADVIEAAKREGAKKLTILAVNKPLGTEDAKRGNSYKGPLYFDIDTEDGDVDVALTSARTLIANLMDHYGCPLEAISIYASGKKGVHVMVDQRAFMQRRTAVKDLPLIYKIMAADLYVTGLDLAPYSVGRNNTFRIANLKRMDGNYRVPVRYHELLELTATKYRELVSKPRPEVHFPDYDGDCSVRLQVLYASAAERLARMDKELSDRSRDLADSDLQKIADKAPPCVEELITGKGTRQGATFNDVALNIGLWAARAGAPEVERERVFAMIADNSESTQRYPTARSRITELDSKYRYVLNSEYKFGCNAMRALVKSGRKVCEGCPLEAGCRGLGGAEFYNDMAEQLGLAQTSTGYIKVMKKGLVEPISTFTLSAEASYMEEQSDGTGYRRRGTLCSLKRHGEVLAKAVLGEEAWASKSNFIRALEGLPGVYYTGGDAEVQKIKMMVFAEEEQMPEIFQVKTAGIHIQQSGPNEIVTYVETGRSLNNLRMVDTHRLTAAVPAPAELFSQTPMTPGCLHTDQALAQLCRINDRETVAIILGWFVAAHLKAHLMHNWAQFPLLSLWGGTGSGKSKTVELLTNLHGQNLLAHRPTNCAALNRFNAIELLSGTSTVPRVCEEYNKNNMPDTQFVMLGELFKAVWSGESAPRGSIQHGKPVSLQIPLSAPVVIQSEQQIEMPSLLERTLVLMMRKSRRNKQAFSAAHEGRTYLRRLGQQMMEEALNLSTKTVQKMMADVHDLVADDHWDDRPAYSLRVVHMGLAWLAQLCRKHRLNDALIEVNALIEAMINVTADSRQKQNGGLLTKRSTSEVSQMIGSINDLAADAGSTLHDMVQRNSRMPNRKLWLLPSTDWRVAADELYLKGKSCHQRHIEFLRSIGQRSRLNSWQDFENLVEHEPYFVAWRHVEEFSFGEPALVLSLSGLRAAGVEVESLKEVYNHFGHVQLEF